MHVQEQEVRKNYIGIVYDSAEEQRAIDALSQSTPFMRQYLRSLMTVLFNRPNKTA
jgi:hypothetical protein